jgi:hypothetical protein
MFGDDIVTADHTVAVTTRTVINNKTGLALAAQLEG